MATAVAEPDVQTLGTKSCSTAKPGLTIDLSERAAEEVKRILAEQQAGGSTEKHYLRLRIVGGGCSGFQPKLDLDPTVNEKLDDTFEVHGVSIVVDKRSALYLDGVKVDFHNDLNKRGFSVDIPSAKTKCGCGSSFSM